MERLTDPAIAASLVTLLDNAELVSTLETIQPLSDVSDAATEGVAASNGENRWDAVAPDTFCWPYGLSLRRGRLAVSDSGNNRVTVWNLNP